MGLVCRCWGHETPKPKQGSCMVLRLPSRGAFGHHLRSCAKVRFIHAIVASHQLVLRQTGDHQLAHQPATVELLRLLLSNNSLLSDLSQNLRLFRRWGSAAGLALSFKSLSNFLKDLIGFLHHNPSVVTPKGPLTWKNPTQPAPSPKFHALTATLKNAHISCPKRKIVFQVPLLRKLPSENLGVLKLWCGGVKMEDEDPDPLAVAGKKQIQPKCPAGSNVLNLDL